MTSNSKHIIISNYYKCYVHKWQSIHNSGGGENMVVTSDSDLAAY